MFSILFINCTGQTKKNEVNVLISDDNTLKDSIKINNPLGYTFKINIGFDDNPVWLWGKVGDNFKENNIIYNHIYGIEYLDEEGASKESYYELDRKSKLVKFIDVSNYLIKPYPGDKTLQLIKSGVDTLLLFKVLEDNNFKRNFKEIDYIRIPSVDLNGKEEKVSSYDIEINVNFLKDNIYEVNMINNDGYSKSIFKSNCDLKGKPVISYYDKVDGLIYLLEENCFLERIKG
jgi:hypothetical protein